MKKITHLLAVLIFFGLNAYSQEKKQVKTKEQRKKEIPVQKQTLNNFLTEDSKRSLDETGFVRCASVEMDNWRRQQDPRIQTRDQFEAWLAPLLQEHKDRVAREKANGTYRRAVVTIPIIYHVITDGTGPTNLSAAQIQAQTDQLNLDFSNGSGSTHPAAADAEVVFIPALIDPNGNALPEPGIDRVTTYGGGANGAAFYDSTIKPNTIWDRNLYANIWTGNLAGGLLGYAQFPSNSTLPGLNPNGGAVNTDGVVCLYTSIGSVANPNPDGGVYASGRTLTHEIGHWIGLRHIWGDSTCGDDFCADTPQSNGSNFGCPTLTTCDGIPDMVENYMDYTDDTCMNIFTADQVARIATVIANADGFDTLVDSTVGSIDFTMTFSPDNTMDICDGANAVYTFDYTAAAGFTDNVTFSATGPGGLSYAFSPASTSADTTVTLTVSGTAGLAVGTYPITVTGTYGGGSNDKELTLNKFSSSFNALTLNSPANGAVDVGNHDLEWAADLNATEYDVEIASDASFTTIVEMQTVTTNMYTATTLATVTEYFWRVKPTNDCADGNWSTTNSFTTANIACNPYNSADTPLNIPDNNATGANSVINVGTPVDITDVNVTVNITHTWDADLTITLTSPAGTVVILSAANGGQDDNYTNTIFDDQATTAIGAGTAPFTGSFQPDGSLATLNGETSTGNWTLNVSDSANFDTGTIDSWSLEICGSPLPDTDGDGIDDVVDNCPNTPNADQADNDMDGLGDVCDDDDDNDTILDVDDNCVFTANTDQSDLDTDGIGDLCDIECATFVSFNEPAEFGADPSSVQFTINIQDDFEVTDVNPKVNITHTWDEDITITLRSPSGTTVELTSGNGGQDDDYTDTVFDDDAPGSIVAGSAPFTGSYQPEGSLADFNGESSLGDWTLTVSDAEPQFDDGMVNSFEMELCVLGEYSPDTDMDGIIDPNDNCVNTANFDQSDIDGDGVGDLCDDDIDGDGILNTTDNCDYTINPNQIDSDNNGIGDSCEVNCGTGSVTSAIAIPDNDPVGIVVPVEIMDDLIVTDVNVTLDITHTWDSDLLIRLISPTGTQIILSENNGGAGANYTGTIFDDAATDAIGAGTAPFTGAFKPDEALSTFNGEESLGNWLLLISDAAAADTGNLNSVTVEVCGTNRLIDEDGDGIFDTDDNCVYTANPDQEDGDSDGIGDACDDDFDNDYILNVDDNCPNQFNPDQADSDGDGIGDVCGLNANTGFSPNGDGINDVWTIDNIQYFPNNKVQVFNRWGNKVFEESGYMNTWDAIATEGVSGSIKLPVGSYMYIIDTGTGGAPMNGWLYINY